MMWIQINCACLLTCQTVMNKNNSWLSLTCRFSNMLIYFNLMTENRINWITECPVPYDKLRKVRGHMLNCRSVFSATSNYTGWELELNEFYRHIFKSPIFFFHFLSSHLMDTEGRNVTVPLDNQGQCILWNHHAQFCENIW